MQTQTLTPHVDTDFECSAIISLLTASSSVKPILLPVRIQEEPNTSPPFSITLSAFIDSGAMGNFIHPRIVKKFSIPTSPHPSPIQLQTVTGSQFFSVTTQVTVQMITRHGHKESIVLNVAPVGKHDLILGLPWCTYHGVQFDWHTSDIIQWSPDCEGRCFASLAPLLVKALTPDAIPPKRATEGAIGYDLHSVTNGIIPPQSQQPVPTGIAIKLPEGTYSRIAPRSGLAVKSYIDIAAGIIDPDYRGELKVVLTNNGTTPFQFQKGDRIAQLILENATLEDVQVTDTLDPTERGEDGFGSTGMTPELAEIFEITLGHTANATLRPITERHQELKQLVPVEYHEFLDVFDADLAMSKCPPHRPGYDFELNLVENAKLPPPAKPYHLSQSEGRILKEWIQGMLDTGMITQCTTRCPTAAPVFFVGKKDRSKRLVIDYRRLNDITIRDAYPLPRIDQIMDQVRGSKVFSKFDMKSGYNQLRVKEGQEWLTAFNTPEGPFQLNVMTFGSSTTTFTRNQS